jgi:enoyl-CoA hydratase
MAMPETVLGLFPDVGATWYLNRCPGRVGLYLAMTGTRLGPGDALWSGLATHYMPNAALDDLIGRLTDAPSLDPATIEAAIAANAGGAPSGYLATRQKGIEAAFAPDTVEGVIAALQSVLSAGGDQTDWRVDALAVLRRASPLSLRATWRRMHAGRGQSIERVLVDDYRMAVRMVTGHDFAEGVRSILVDKDNAPRWDPARLEDLPESAVDALLAPMPAGEDSRGLVAGDLTFD